jgi:hypothetical protein
MTQDRNEDIAVLPEHDPLRRSLLLGSGIAAGMALAGGAAGQTAPVQVETDTASRTLDGKAVPERSAGPVRAGRGSALIERAAAVIGAA